MVTATKSFWPSTARGQAILLAATAPASMAFSANAWADDVNITTNVASGVNLDTQVGTTAQVATGVTVTNADFSRAITATTSAWTVTNRGTVSSKFANSIQLDVTNSAVVNFGSVVAGSSSNAISLTGGGMVDNKAGATISSDQSAVILGKSTGGMGTFTNAGTITQTGTSGDLVTLLFGGTATNLAGGTITANNTSNALSVGQGASRVVINSGTIVNTGASFATGVLVQGGPSTVTNNAGGIIRGTYNGVYASASAPLTFSNAGLIESTGPNASARAVEATGGGTLVNTGTIKSASSDGIYAARAATVTNSGTIQGAVRAINFSGAFARTLNLDTGSVLIGQVQGGTGIDDLVLLGTGTEDISKFLAFETLSLQGTAWTVNGTGTFTTSAAVQSGKLTVAGTLTTPTLTVGTGGTLGGTGSVAGLVSAAPGGKIAPGNGIGTLTVGSLAFTPGSIYEVEANSSGAADRINVTGTATITSGTVQVLAENGTYAANTQYVIVSTAGGVSGAGFTGATSNLAFLTPSLQQTANAVILTLSRNSVDLDAIGGTANQRAAGRGIQTVGTGALYTAVLSLDAPAARAAFDVISGEIHASLHTALFEDSRFAREAVLHRLEREPETGFSVWADGFGDWGSSDANANAARLGRDSSGVFGGIDLGAGEHWRLGVAGGYSQHTLDLPTRFSSGQVNMAHGIVYAGAKYGGLRLAFGAGYSHLDTRVDRRAVFTGFTDRLSASYAGSVIQGFGELGYRIGLGGGAMEPFARVAVVNVNTDAFAEVGGAAALRGAAGDETRTTTTLGLHFATPVAGALSVDARIGWQHAFGAAAPISTLSLAGGAGFGVRGVSISRDAGVAEGGFTLQATPSLAMWARYSGAIGDQGHNNGVKGGISLVF